MTTPWHRGRLLAWDLETTAPQPTEARIVTATIIELHNGVVRTRQWLVDPGVEIPEGAAAIHGITTEQARAEGMDAATAVQEIADELRAWSEAGLPVVAYNLAYDATVLDRELRRHHGRGLHDLQPAVDPFVIDKAVDRFRRGKRTLTAACEHYGVRLDGAHDATADALAAARVAWALAERHPDVVQVPLGQLHAAQVGWKAEQAASLEDYFRRQGKDEHVSRAWPITPFTERTAA